MSPLPVLLLLLAAAPQTTVKNRAPLQPTAFKPLPLTSVRPAGWLRRQLDIQAEGLSGHIDEFWPDLGRDSGWLGGKGESWERGPYYLDGLVPLANLLDDPILIAKVKRWIDWTLNHQRADGFLGPDQGEVKNRGWWPRMVLVKVLQQHYDATGDSRVIPALEKYFEYQRQRMPQQPLETWAKHRWGDELGVILWLYNRNGDSKLLELAKMLHDQGFDWKSYFDNFPYTGKVTKKQANQDTHVVNNAMSLKTFTLWWQVSGDENDRGSLARQLAVMDRYLLLPNGAHSGDEHYAGLSPVQGTELCAIVEGMYSLEQAIAVLGNPAWADRLEKLAFNPLPGTFSADMWSHQYDQQPNQVLVDVNPRDWSTNGPESNLFGLEPNFGCCTSNFHQGWPKFAASLWMETGDKGVAAIAYAPSVVSTRVGDSTNVKIREETAYPFRDTIQFFVNPSRPENFPLMLRIPAWAEGATLKINDKAVKATLQPGTFHRVARTWRPGDRVELKLPMKLRIVPGYNGSVSVERGPLVYSLKIGEKWTKLRDKSPAADWEVHPTTPWNYGLLIDPEHPEKTIEVTERPLTDVLFDPSAAPVELKAKAVRLPDWGMERGSAAPPPVSPVKASGDVETVTLVPYGAAKLRITAFPRVTR